MGVGCNARERRHDSTTRYACDDPPRTSLGMSAQTTHPEGHDSREADGLEEENHVEQRHTRPASLRDGRGDEDDTRRQESQEDPTRADPVHDERAEEATACEGPLCSREETRSAGITRPGLRVSHVIDEIGGDGYLRARVAKLSGGGVEKAILLPERLVVRVGVGLGGLERHVGVRDLGDPGEEECERKEEDEDADGHVHPLHILEGRLVIEGEEHV